MSWYNEKNNNWDTNDKMIMTAAQIEKKIQDIFDLRDKGIDWHYRSARNAGVSHDQFMEAARRAGHRYSGGFGSSWGGSLNLNEYVGGLRRGIKHKEMMDVDDHGYKLQGYCNGRANWGGDLSSTHREAMDALQKRIPITYYGNARKAGATHSQVIDAKKQKVNIGIYANLRGRIKNHKEAIEAAKLKLDPYEYRQAKISGASHKEIIDASNKGIDLYNYGELRKQCDSHQDVIDLDNKFNQYNANVNDYVKIRRSGATEPEAFDAIQKGINSRSYYLMKIHNPNLVTHENCLDAIQKNVPANGYNNLRKTGSNHEDAIKICNKFNNNDNVIDYYATSKTNGSTDKQIEEALSHNINLSDYSWGIRNKSHVEYMTENAPNYNPYDLVDWTKSSSNWFNK